MPEPRVAPLLGAYAAKQCPYRLFREYDPTEPAVAAEPDDALQELFDDGLQFEADIFAELLRLHGADAVAIPGRDEADPDERRALTDAALAAGTPLILGALMQPDVAGRRMGEIDVLVATGDVTHAGRTVYRPVDVKSHRTTRNVDEPAEPELVHDLRLLGPPHPVAGFEPKYREDDCLQLAHYYRLLRTHGHAKRFGQNEPVMAGIIGSERVVAWFDLNRPAFATLTPQEREGDDGAPEIIFHRRGRSTNRTALSRYNFEFAFRLKVVDEAMARTTRDDQPIVRPVSVPECRRCPWQGPCHDDMEVIDDVSLVAGVGYPEWRVHRFMGIETARQLADLDLTTASLMAAHGEPDPSEPLDALTRSYADTPLSPNALVKQIQSARARVAGRLLVAPGWDDAQIPRGDIEIDLDLESATPHGVYLWGARLTRVPEHWPEVAGTFQPFASFDPSPDEADLVAQLWRWLSDIRERAERDDLTVRVYGYSSAGTEAAQLRRIVAGGGDGLPDVETIESFIASDQWVDLLPYMRLKFWSNQGHGLKVVAAACGFGWRDDDPGGYASTRWYDDAVAGIDREANIARLLAYNEDDCAATAALRPTP